MALKRYLQNRESFIQANIKFFVNAYLNVTVCSKYE